MCGRYATTRSSLDLSEIFEADDETDGAVVPDYNVAPTDPVPVVLADAGRRALRVARWGLVPPWSSDPRMGARMINARAETVATSRAYARSFRERRCLVPADGWYEWRPRPDGRGKQPYFMTSPDGGVLVFAGVWARSGAGVLTCSVLTTAAVGALRSVHDRMPLLLPPERWSGWLAGPPPSDDDLLPAAELAAAVEVRPVGPAIGDVRNDGPELVLRVTADCSPSAHNRLDDPTLF